MAECRFQAVPVGGRFIYQEEPFLKSTTLIAIHEGSGAQRLIPRSAPVRLVPTDAPTEKVAAEPGDSLAAFETYHHNCLVRLSEFSDRIDPKTMEQLERALEQEHQSALRTLRR